MADKALAVTASDFEEKVIKSQIPVLVDFWATWCGPCVAIGPTLDALAREWEGKVLVVKVNVDSESVLASGFGITSIPTLLLMKNGQIVEKIIGARSKSDFEALLKKHI